MKNDFVRPDDDRISEALTLAFHDALREHRLRGEPVVVMDGDVVVSAPAEVIERELGINVV
jgi:hypothetical protein